MTRNAHRTVIRNIPPVFPVNVCPLNEPRPAIRFSATRTHDWFTKFSSQPVMEGTVRSLFSFPARVVYPSVFLSQGFYSVLLKVCAFFPSKSGSYSPFCNFLVPYSGITSAGTKRPVGGVGWRIVSWFIAFHTIYFRHGMIIGNCKVIGKC